jgi:hypothetical protein
LVTEKAVLSIAVANKYRKRVEFPSIDERVKNLCAKAANAHEAEAREILAELRDALKEHTRFVRLIASRTLNRVNHELPLFPSSQNADQDSN